ncbi:MAG: 30S ribosomal protein S7 [Candidatus Vogelbacteria bacterium]
MRRKVTNAQVSGPDERYQSLKIGKMINYLMHRGQKATATQIAYDAFDHIKEETKQEPLEVFEEALKNAGPHTELRSRRVGGANYQIPHEVTPKRRLALSLRWLLEAARSKKGSPMARRLADQLILASKNDGEAVKKKENVHKMAEANRAFAHFARTNTRPTISIPR